MNIDCQHRQFKSGLRSFPLLKPSTASDFLSLFLSLFILTFGQTFSNCCCCCCFCEGHLKNALSGFEVDGSDDFSFVLKEGPIVDHRLDLCKDVFQLVE